MISDLQKILLAMLGASLFRQNMSSIPKEDVPLPANTATSHAFSPMLFTAVANDAPSQTVSPMLYTAIANEAISQTVFPMVYTAMEKKLPKEKKEFYREYYLSSLASGLRNVAWHEELHKMMAERKIPYVIIKGLASGIYYPQPVLRISGDVDFMVRRQDVERTKELLLAHGFTLGGNTKHQAHFAFHKGEEILEMHWEPNGLPEGPVGYLCRLYLKDIFTTSKKQRVGNGVCRIPGVFHHGLILLVHTATHMIDTGIGLRHLCDWAMFAASLGDQEFCEIFEEKLKNVGLWHFAQLLTQLSVRYLGCPKKLWAEGAADEKLLEAMMEDIFAAGNFGRKDQERINEAKLMTTRGSATVDGSNLALQLLRALTEKAEKEMPVCRKLVILRPVGWVYVSLCHVRLMLLGKKPNIHLRKMVGGARKRRAVYKELRLYAIK